jgi:hypothetical protein
MFTFIRKFSQGAGAAIAYITVGILAMIWTGVWFWAMRDHGVPGESLLYYLCAGFFLTGLALTGIGLLIGHIAQEGKKADTNQAAVAAPGVGVPVAAPTVQAPVMAAPMMPTGVVSPAPRAPVMTNADKRN